MVLVTGRNDKVGTSVWYRGGPGRDTGGFLEEHSQGFARGGPTDRYGGGRTGDIGGYAQDEDRWRKHKTALEPGWNDKAGMDWRNQTRIGETKRRTKS